MTTVQLDFANSDLIVLLQKALAVNMSLEAFILAKCSEVTKIKKPKVTGRHLSQAQLRMKQIAADRREEVDIEATAVLTRYLEQPHVVAQNSYTFKHMVQTLALEGDRRYLGRGFTRLMPFTHNGKTIERSDVVSSGQATYLVR